MGALLVAGVHFFHAGLVDFGAFINPSEGCIFLMLLFELFLEDFLFLLDDLGFFLLELLEAHDQSLEGALVGLLQDEVLYCWI